MKTKKGQRNVKRMEDFETGTIAAVAAGVMLTLLLPRVDKALSKRKKLDTRKGK